MDALNTEEDFRQLIEKRFHQPLTSLGIAPSVRVISNLAHIFKETLVRIRRLNEKNPSSKVVSSKARKMREDSIKKLETNGGLLETSIRLFAKEVNELFGCSITGQTASLEAFLFPQKIYIKHCTAISIKRRFTQSLFEFHTKHTGKPLKLNNDREYSNDGGSFHYFYKLFEDTLINLCEINPNNITYTEKGSDRTTYRFLHYELSAYKHRYTKKTAAIAQTPTNTNYLSACPLFTLPKPMAITVKSASSST
jgi:hypothetical protein